jgi:hypothetical protein
MCAHRGCTLLWSVQPLPLLSLTPFLSTPLIFQQLSIHMLISSTFTFYVMWHYWCSIIVFSFPSFPEVHRVVPLLQTCFTSEFVYNSCFCVYVYIGSILSVWKKTWSCCVLDPGLLHLTQCPPIASIYLQTTCHYSLWLSNTSLCIYTTFSWCIHQ